MKYKIDFINSSYRRFFKKHKREIVGAFIKCAKYGDFMLRDETRKFERKLAKYVGTKYAIAVNSGTDAMFLSLKALGVGLGDEVITVSHTFIATIQAIVHTGAKPVLVDVNEDELMDMNEVKKAITKKTKVVLPVHFHGKVCDMKRLREVSGKALIYVIEDAAQALGAKRYHSEWAGEQMAGNFGDTGCFSFNFPKLMGAYGDAGAITTNDEELYKRLLLLRNHWNITQGSVRQEEYPQPEIMDWGWKSRMDNIQAAILNVKFKYLDKMLKRRMEIALKYNREFEDLPIIIPEFPKGSVCQEYIIRVEDQDKFKKFMDECGVELLIRDTTPNHLLKGLNLDHFKLPITEILSKQAIRIPCYPELKDSEVNHIIKNIRKFYDR